MKIPWKGLAILGVLIASILYDLPTLMTYLPQDPAVKKQELEIRLAEIQKQSAELRNLGLAIPEADKKRIQLLLEEDQPFPAENPILEKILDGNFEYEKNESGSYLNLKKGTKRVFISKISDRLNGVLTNIRRVKDITLDEFETSIVFNMEEGKRISTQTEPFLTLLGEDLELSYQEEKKRYITRTSEMAGVVNLGLDLQGGMYLDIGVEAEAVVRSVMDRLIEELENSLIDDNINYVSLERIADNKVELILEVDENFDLSGENYTRLLERSYDISPVDSGYQITLKAEEVKRISERAIDQALETIRNRIDQLGVKEPSVQRQGDNSVVIRLPGLKDPDAARRVIGRVAVLNFMGVVDNGNPESLEENQVLLYQEVRDPVTKELISTVPYVMEKKVLLSGNRIRDARVGFQQTGSGAYVTMSFDDVGKDQFAEITSQFVNRRIAIVLDGKVQSAPRVNEKISGGEAQITGNFTTEEASELALVLRSGALPAPIVIHEERTVGASLGEDSIKQALLSLVLGFCIVVVFMMIYYEVSGVFSVLALFFNLILIVAALAYFGATLTLPGMAGIVLTIGMAVDANVLIFERIREEITRGTPIRGAIQVGFQKATVTILDSNITTILAAIVLFQFGTGPIKGFAVTLSIGIAASMFTSIIVGRFLFETVYLRRKSLTKISI